MALVELLISPLPAHVRTARLVVTAAARRAGMADELLDELKLALGEACSRAVGLHALHAADVPVSITVEDDATGLLVRVTDVGPPAGQIPGDLSETSFQDDVGGDGDDAVHPDVALAVLAGLVDDLDVATEQPGTVVSMRFPLPPRAVGAGGPGSTVLASS